MSRKVQTLILTLALVALLPLGFNACDQLNSSSQSSSAGYKTDADVLSSFPQGTAQLKVLCARNGQDKVSLLFCSGGAPKPYQPYIASLADLQTQLGLSFTGSSLPSFALTGNSTALTTKSVNAINPRAIVFSAGKNFVAVSFTRGEEFVEVAAGDPVSGSETFFLLSIAHSCSASKSCTNADLLTPLIEKNWTSLSVYSDEDLKSTILDCRQCHQPGGPSTAKFLRMQELTLPWSHWFENNLAGGKALEADFHAAHGVSEDYGGIPANLIDQSNPPALQAMIQLIGDDAKQTIYNSSAIEADVVASNSAQPTDNTIPGVSATWSTAYANFVAGQSIQTPYHDIKVTSPSKLAAAVTVYKSVIAGTAAPASLPDIRDIFPDDVTQLADLGFRMQPGSSAQTILTNACGQCHNSNLDQNISRALFNVNLATMTAAEKAVAVSRITQPIDSLLLMPPRRFRTLTPAEITSLTNLLSK